MKTQYLVLFLLSLVVLQSCVDEIELDLDAHNTTYIIVDAVITDITDEQRILLNYTATYDSNTKLPPVVGASVSVSDGDALYIFSELEPGVYICKGFRGKIGKTYALTIKHKGELYHATSTMHPPFEIDSVWFVDFPYGMPRDKPHFDIFINGQGAAKENQCYVFQYAINDVWVDTLYKWTLYNDFLNQGKYLPQVKITTYETYSDFVEVSVRALSCDEDYLYYLEACIFNVMPNMFFSPPKANVKGNISNNALGYFLATAVCQTKNFTADISLIRQN